MVIQMLIMSNFSFEKCFIAVVDDRRRNILDHLRLGILYEHASRLGVSNDEPYFVVCLCYGSSELLHGSPVVQNLFATVLVLDEGDANEIQGLGDRQSLAAKDIVLYASPVFVNHYHLAAASSHGFSVKRVQPVPMASATICAHTDEAYKRLIEPRWTTDVLVRLCRHPLLLRRGDAVNLFSDSVDCPHSDDRVNSRNLFSTTVVECEPVEQGILTTSTSLTIVRASTLYPFPHLHTSDLDQPYALSTTRVKMDFLRFLSVLSTVAVIFASCGMQTRSPRLASVVARILTIVYRVLCSWKLLFKVQILAQSPVRCGSPFIDQLDPFHTVFVRTSVLRRHAITDLSWAVVSIYSSGGVSVGAKKRCVQLCSIERLAGELNWAAFGEVRDDVCYITPSLWFNLNHHPFRLLQPGASVILKKYSRQPSLLQGNRIASVREAPPFAREIHVSVVQSPLCGALVNCDIYLSEYFKVSRLMCPGDVFCLFSTEQASSSLSLPGSLTVRPNVIYFRVSRLEGDADRIDEGLLVDRVNATLYQVGTCQTYVPCTMDNFWLASSSHSVFDSPLPAGFSKSCEEVSNILLPYLDSQCLRKSTLNTVCLSGPRGSGKSVVLTAVSKQFNLHLCSIGCWELIGESVGATASRIQTVVQKAVSYAPCLLVLKNVHLIGKDGSGMQDGESRIILAFKEALLQLNEICRELPVFVVGTTADFGLLCPALAQLFLHTVHLKAFTDDNRTELLRVFLRDFNVGLRVSVDSLVQKTSGFLLADFCALVARAKVAAHQRISLISNTGVMSVSDKDECEICLAGPRLLQCDFEEALAQMQNDLSEAIGAPKIPNVKWEDVGGLEDVKAEILDTVQLPLQHPHLFASGLRRSGVLLFGPPGTGKTLLAKAVATECLLNFLSVKGPELINMYVGQSEENVRKIFQLARHASPCIIFFDELDSLAPNRGCSGDSGGVMDRVVSQLLSEMDGLHRSNDVFVMGATNRPDLLDPALLRPGRFDKLLYVGISADAESRLKILTALARKFHLDDSVILSDVADKCPSNLTGADYSALCSDAILSATSRTIKKLDLGIADVGGSDDVVVTFEDFEDALRNLTPSVSTEELVRYSNLMHRMKQ